MENAIHTSVMKKLVGLKAYVVTNERTDGKSEVTQQHVWIVKRRSSDFLGTRKYEHCMTCSKGKILGLNESHTLDNAHKIVEIGSGFIELLRSGVWQRFGGNSSVRVVRPIISKTAIHTAHLQSLHFTFLPNSMEGLYIIQHLIIVLTCICFKSRP